MTTNTNTATYEFDYTPTDDDIQAYNEDQAALDEEAKAKADGTWGITHCPDGTLHNWRELTTSERIGAYELASESEINRARICFKCGAWK